MTGPQTPDEIVSTKMHRIASIAKRMPDESLRSLAHHMDNNWLEAAYKRTRKDGAAGIDGMTASEYSEGLQENLLSLLDRAKSGRYRAPAVKRVYIPKGDGRNVRALGIPTLEDKILQRAVVMLLEPVYEQDFLDCSYGFRPGRNAHQALEHLWKQTMDMEGCWLVEVDIKDFFDSVEHEHLRSFVRKRVCDGVLTRLIGKWLKAGVMEDGFIQNHTQGTPQGGVISPLLANIYLHEVMDKWFEEQIRPAMKGCGFLIRYADDFVMGFANEEDARRMMAVLPKRLGKYGLTLHPEKTRLIDFRRPPKRPGGGGKGGSGTFDLLGFTHFWGKGRRNNWVVKRKTAKSRFARAVKSISLWCRRFRHRPVREQHDSLQRKLQGHYGYYGITGNMAALSRFRQAVEREWRKWLHRRSQKRRMPWRRFKRLLTRYPLPRPRVVHSSLRCTAKP